MLRCASVKLEKSTAMANPAKRDHALESNRQMKTLRSLPRAMFTGALGFGLVSLCVFATVAFCERWMYTHLGTLGAYLVWTALFILLGGAVLGSLVVGRWRLPKFCLLFGVAFFAYAAGWTFAYFILRGGVGEWAGSLIGSILMAMIFAVGFGAARSVFKLSCVLFVANSCGYFLGSALNDYAGGRRGMLLWGIIYGLFLGAGIGAVLQLSQVEDQPLTAKSPGAPRNRKQ
jgi:hypothetical protein